MKRTSSHKDNRRRIIVVGADDIAQHLRKLGYRVLALTELPEVGIATADAAVLELSRSIDVRSAQRFRTKLVEPVVIYHRRPEQPRAFLGVCRWWNGSLKMGLVLRAVENAMKRTDLLRQIEQEDRMEGDAPTEIMTLEIPRPAGGPLDQTVVGRGLRSRS